MLNWKHAIAAQKEAEERRKKKHRPDQNNLSPSWFDYANIKI